MRTHAILLLMLFLCLPVYLSGQVTFGNLYQDYMAAKRNDPAYWSTVRGSPYETDEFAGAEVFFRNNPKPEIANLRYNILFDEMELHQKNNEEFLILDRKETIDSIVMDDVTYRYLVFGEGREINQGYFLQLNSGKCNLFLKKTREFQPEKKPTGGYQDYTPPSIVLKPERFYVQFENNIPLLLPQTSRRIVSLFRENGFNINEYAKNNRIRYNEESLMSLFEYCNSL